MNNLKRLKVYKNIIYDFDGTIVRLNIDWKGWHRGVGEIFRSFDPSFNSKGEVDSFQNEFIGKFGKKVSRRLSEFNANYELRECKSYIPNGELIRFIKENKNKNQFILTSQNKPLLNKLLRELGLENSFQKIITRGDVTFVKPNPEGLEKLLNGDKKGFIMLGDSKWDEEAAKQAGIDFEKISIPNKHQ